MQEFFHSTKAKVLLAVLVLLGAFMLRAIWTGGFSPMMSQLLGAVASPVQQLSSNVSNGVGDFFSQFTQASKTAKENEELRSQVAELNQQLVELEDLRQENRRLEAMLGIQEEHEELDMVPAGVIGRDYNSRFGSFTIDKGSHHGVEPRDPVISEEGLVGIVSEVGLTHSKVITILDVSLNVGAVDNRVRETGIVTGNIDLAQQGLCMMNYLDRESGAFAGDLVITSGSDGEGLFPEGLVIGTITEVQAESSGLSLYAVIQPAAPIYELRDVYVITDFLGQGETLGQ
ncbi:MAG: rod shape-determining protein MreC [Oscillospiraceae bacterium]|nr:rod shape-determining protein MreC [Oscillospiraceae bacterium]